MTLLMAWLNRLDDPTSLNFAADSLLTETAENAPRSRWPHATKIFRFFPTHDHICYCGDSLLALSAIHQIIALISCTEVLSTTGLVGSRAGAFRLNMAESVRRFPQAWGRCATILYGGFDRMLGQFKMFRLTASNAGIDCQDESLEGIRVFGSGAGAAVRQLPTDYRKARDVIQVLDNVIGSQQVPTVGGFPQMVIVTKNGSKPQAFNRVVNGRPETILYGVPIQFHSSLPRVQCRDERFRVVRSARDGTVRRATV